MRRELKLIILVFLLVVGPAVILSFLAGRVLGNWQVIFQKRMETEAARTLEHIANDWTERLDGIRSDLQISLRSQSPEISAANGAVSNAWFAGLFVYQPGRGLVYPVPGESALAFMPHDEQALRLHRAFPHGGLVESAVANPALTIREYRQILEQPGLTADLASRLRLQIGSLFRNAGQRDEALASFCAVADLPVWPIGGSVALGRTHEIPQHGSVPPTNALPACDPEEGFFYDLVALQEMARLYAQSGDTLGAKRADFELLRRALDRYDALVVVQREEVMAYLADALPRYGGGAAEDQAALWQARWRERLRERRLDSALRARLEQEMARLATDAGLQNGWVWARVATNEFLVTVAGGTGSAGGLGRLIGVQMDRQALERAFEQIAAAAARPAGLVIQFEVVGAHSFTANASRQGTTSAELRPLLAERRMAPPFDRVTLRAYPVDPRAYFANVRLQARLYGWGGLVLIGSVVLGGWLIWREAAAEIRAARERSAFAAAVSHDLRTPLSSMRMLAESLYLGRIADDGKRQRFLATILKESDRLSRLTDRALYFIRFGQGTLRYQLTEGDLAGLVRDAVETFATGIGGRVIETGTVVAGCGGSPARQSPAAAMPGLGDDVGEWVVNLAIDAALPAVSFDAGALEQVIFNLLDNAAKYSRDSRRIDVKVAAESENERVRIAVTDYGIGIANVDLARIFRAYQRGGGTGHTAGLGLGLALCRKIVKAHRGRIDVQSKIGNGSTFTVNLPVSAGGSRQTG